MEVIIYSFVTFMTLGIIIILVKFNNNIIKEKEEFTQEMEEFINEYEEY